MKFISYSIFFAAFAAIVALGVLVVVPQFQRYHEEKLTIEAEAALNEVFNQSDVVVDHHYARQVVITKLSVSESKKKEIASRAAEILRDIPGLYGDEANIVVRSQVPELFEKKAIATKEKKVIKTPDAGEIVDSGSNAVSPKRKDAAIVLKFSKVDVFWDDKKSHFKLTGEVAEAKMKSDTAANLQSAFKEATIHNEIKVVESGMNKSFQFSGLSSSVYDIISKSHRAGSIHYTDEPRSLIISGMVASPAEYKAVSKQLSELDAVAVENQIFIQPRFTVEKDAKSKTITLNGYVKDTAVILGVGSSASKLPGYSRNNQIRVLKECSEIEWSEQNQKELAYHLTVLDEGELVYQSGQLIEIHGTTHDKNYKQTIDAAFEGSASKLKLKHNKLPEPVPEKSVSLAQKLKHYRIFFKSSSSYVAKEYDPQLKEIAEAIKASHDKTSMIVIGAYADNSGNPESNKTLSLTRARSVLQKLVALGVPAKRTKIEFFGAEDITDKKYSRRVEIKVARPNAEHKPTHQNQP